MAIRPLVSVFIPAYNAEKTIRQAIESVLAQTYPNYRLLILDDASTDGTADIINRYAVHSQVTIHHHPENLGVTRNWNRGLALCQGELVARLDADDYYAPDYLAQVVTLFQKFPETGLVFTGANLLSDRSVVELPYPESWVKRGRDFLPDLLRRCPIRASSVCVRQSFYQQLGGVIEEMPNIHEDWEMWVRIAATGNVGYIAKPLVYYRLLNPSGCTSSAIKNARSPAACAIWLNRLAEGSLPYQLTAAELSLLKQGMLELVLAFAAFALEAGYEDSVQKHLDFARTLLPASTTDNGMQARLYARAAEVFLMEGDRRQKGWQYLLKSMRYRCPPVELGRFLKLWARALLGNTLFNFVRSQTVARKSYSVGTPVP